MAPDNTDLTGALRDFVRTRGAAYLADPNVTSIGIGHKVVDGRHTDQVAVQFTVGTKVSLEALPGLNTTALPESITVAGVEVPTDVLERSYRPSFKVVEEAQADDRKVRIDPVRPGVSVGHPKVTCGTIGAIVYDKADGTPYVLSNWHVLNGAAGVLGDEVVQPGAYDDNRVDRNGLGKLTRSYLGIAGDAAVATVVGRGIDPSVLGIDVAPEDIGDPELGDKVVKSGRTSGVTHGVVRRVDTIVKLDYGGSAGVQQVGCFEIGVDPAHKPAGGQISQGGDSGAAWLFKSGNGRPAKVLAGLHFAGEGSGDPDEHALACLPQSVFDKLQVSLRRPAAEDIEAAKAAKPAKAAGYDAQFLGLALPAPGFAATTARDAFVLNGSTKIDYTHFSLALSTARKFALWVAWNVDGKQMQKLARTGLQFVKDPRIPATAQTGDEVYKDNRLDRGHIARRADLTWGPDAQRANRDSFYFTNITPQMDDFNQSMRDGLWGKLEDAIYADVEVDHLRISVFGGPVLRQDDRPYRGALLPREYWKVIASVQGGALKASAFVLSQNLDELEALDFAEFRVYQVALTDLAQRVSLTFPDALLAADTAPATTGAPLTALEQISWS
ncbi:DNA/RNA non-specific endonuclease [Actinokineospora inagensis]|uniref:DNA/RNA non-specific endonuclease n=1 Tax=Actinokineospora inagensis TaxID=103730 RepID=UPI00040CA121|nr:DNA/RNA non-specific endonuclease [Actinokineospora inagensis]